MAGDEPPGPPPRDGLVWNPGTHRWRSNHTGAEVPHPESPDETASEVARENPQESSKPGVLARMALAAKSVHDAAYGWAVRQTPLFLSLAPDILDTPQDFQKIGFNPSLHGTAGPNVHDPLKDSLGISSHLAMSIASKLLAKLFVTLKGSNNQFAEPDLSPLVEPLRQLLADVYRSLGIPNPPIPDAATMLKSLQGLAAEKASLIHVNKESDDASEPTGQAPDPTAVAGRDGEEFTRLIRTAQDRGSELLWSLVLDSVLGYTGTGPLLRPQQMDQLTDALASVNATAELMGRSRVREHADRSATSGQGLSTFADDAPLSKFADLPSAVIDSPEAALQYFLSLEPSLSVDPGRFAGEQRRKAFTLAVATNDTLTARVQQEIATGIRQSKSTADVTKAIADAIRESGVSPRHPQYAEMVFRTNAADAYQTGVYEEARSPDVADLFPVWKYIGIRDGRQGKDHEPHFDKYYPAHATFADVRGGRPFNCRCTLQWVDLYDWKTLQSQGARIEPGY